MRLQLPVGGMMFAAVAELRRVMMNRQMSNEWERNLMLVSMSIVGEPMYSKSLSIFEPVWCLLLLTVVEERTQMLSHICQVQHQMMYSQTKRLCNQIKTFRMQSAGRNCQYLVTYI